MKKFVMVYIGGLFMIFSSILSAKDVELKVGEMAPIFKAQNQEGKVVDLSSRKDQGFTVLYFYPKADTPGCTKQACAFRDSIKVIHELGAEVYGISGDTVEDQKKFHDKHGLKFDLLADPEAKVIELYGAKMPVVKISKRWTFIIDPDLKIRSIDRDVDPMLDAVKVAEKIKGFR